MLRFLFVEKPKPEKSSCSRRNGKRVGVGGDGAPPRVAQRRRSRQPEAAKNPGKRGFEDTVNIDLKLQLQTPADVKEALAEAGEKVEKSASHHNVVACRSVVDSPEKPPAPKAQVVGWPPVRSFRKNILKGTAEDAGGGEKSGNSLPATLVKVSMDGAPYLRKLDLKACGSYQDLSIALQKMFSSFTTGTGGMSGGDFVNERKVMDLLNGSEFVPTYEDKDGDWMLVGDVPWEMFVYSCKRLRIMKGTEAIGFAPRAMEKCKNRG